MNKGKFISFEGIEGVGKSTTITKIQHYLQENGIEVCCTREPGGTEFGESIRNILLDNNTNITAESESLLLFSIRNQHINEIIIPNLDKGTWVLCDRYIDASIAYQGYGKKVSLEKINLLIENFTEKIIPDLTIFFDLSHELAIKRFPKTKSKDRFENLSDKFFDDVYNGYLKIANSNSSRVKKVDSRLSQEEVCNLIINEVSKLLK